MIARLAGRLRAVARLGLLGGVLGWAAVETLFLPEGERAAWLQRSSRRALRVLGVRVGATGVTPRGAVVVANHLGYLDILVLASLAPGLFVAKREVRTWPVFGWFARRAGTHFIDRERKSDVVRIAAEFAPVIAAGANLVLFPEGTSTDGRAVLPFKSSLLAPVARAGWPAVPAAIAYAVPPPHSAEREVYWWGDRTLVPHLVGLASLPHIDATVAWGDAIVASGDRKALAVELHRAVRSLRGDLPVESPVLIEA